MKNRAGEAASASAAATAMTSHGGQPITHGMRPTAQGDYSHLLPLQKKPQQQGDYRPDTVGSYQSGMSTPDLLRETPDPADFRNRSQSGSNLLVVGKPSRETRVRVGNLVVDAQLEMEQVSPQRQALFSFLPLVACPR